MDDLGAYFRTPPWHMTPLADPAGWRWHIWPSKLTQSLAWPVSGVEISWAENPELIAATSAGLGHGSASVERYRRRWSWVWFIDHIWPLVTSQDSQDMLRCLLPLVCEDNLPSWLGSWRVSCRGSWLTFAQGLIWITPTSWTGMVLVHAHKITHGDITHMYKHMLYTNVWLCTFAIDQTSVCPWWWSFNLQLSYWSNFCSGLSDNGVFHTMAIGTYSKWQSIGLIAIF